MSLISCFASVDVQRQREPLKCIAVFFPLATRDLERYVGSIYRLHVTLASAAHHIDLNLDFLLMSRNRIMIKETNYEDYDMEVLQYSIISFSSAMFTIYNYIISRHFQPLIQLIIIIVYDHQNLTMFVFQILCQGSVTVSCARAHAEFMQTGKNQCQL